MNKLSKTGNALLATTLVVMTGTSTLINVSAEVGLEAGQVSTELTQESDKAFALEVSKDYIATINELKIGVSKKRLLSVLHDYDFSETTIEYVIAEIGIDWKDQAVMTLEYLIEGLSAKSSIKEELAKAFGFTEEETEFAINSIDWIPLVARSAAELIKANDWMSKNSLTSTLLEHYGYSEEEVKKGLESLDVDWNHMAIMAAEFLLESGTSKELLKINMEHFDFTEEEFDYVISNLEIDWNEQALKIAKELLEGSLDQEEVYELLIHYGFTEEEAEYGVANAIKVEDTEDKTEADDSKDETETEVSEETPKTEDNVSSTDNAEASKPSVNDKDVLPSTGLSSNTGIFSSLLTMSGVLVLAYNKKRS